jgi:hypothetical protein
LTKQYSQLYLYEYFSVDPSGKNKQAHRRIYLIETRLLELYEQKEGQEYKELVKMRPYIKVLEVLYGSTQYYTHSEIQAMLLNSTALI